MAHIKIPCPVLCRVSCYFEGGQYYRTNFHEGQLNASRNFSRRLESGVSVFRVSYEACLACHLRSFSDFCSEGQTVYRGCQKQNRVPLQP